jgi:hypothetical protein
MDRDDLLNAAAEAGEIDINPCEGCSDWDKDNDRCISDGGCAGHGKKVLRDTARVIEIGDRFFYGFGKNDQIKTAWSLGGAKLFSGFTEAEIEAVEKKLGKKGKKYQRRYISVDH